MTPFDVVHSPLRLDGRDAVPHPLLIEASAGSGKTWTLAHLASRLLIEDDIDPTTMLVVTFTRDAARNLRSRVRDQLRSVVTFLENPEANWVAFERKTREELHGIDDDKIALVLTQDWRQIYRQLDSPTCSEWLARGLRKLGELDGLRAQTIHSFAQDYSDGPTRQIMKGDRLKAQAFNEVLASAVRKSPDLYRQLSQISLVELIEKLAFDYYDAGGRGSHLPLPPTLRLVPTEADLVDDPHREVALFSRTIVEDTARRYAELLEAAGLTTFGDLLVALRRRLDGPHGRAFKQEMRHNFRVVMIDEFQDTDPLQWSIFEDLFKGAPETRLVMVGDPKQAIYAFRSGSVDTFLAVRDQCEREGVPISTLNFNHRSTEGVLNAVNTIFRGASFTYPVSSATSSTINFESASAWPQSIEKSTNLLAAGDLNASVHIRAGKYESKSDTTEVDVVRYVQLLHERGEKYSDIAVLCYTNRQCLMVQSQLRANQIPSVSSSDDDVFKSPAALHLRLLLAALAEPEHVAYTAALAMTWFREIDNLHVQINEVVSDFAHFGVSAVVRFIRRQQVMETTLATRDGERNITDLLHLTEALARECRDIRALPLLLTWLDAARETESSDEKVEARRLETESDAVQIMTIHKSKGLEFSTVLLPYMLRQFPSIERSTREHERLNGLIRWDDPGCVTIDVASLIPWGHVAERRVRRRADLAAETRRMIYVAMTRAVRHLVVWVLVPTPSGFYKPESPEWVRMFTQRDGEGSSSSVRNHPFSEVLAGYVEGSSFPKPTDDVVFEFLTPLWSDITCIALSKHGSPLPGRGTPGGELTDGADLPALEPEVVTKYASASPIAMPFRERRWSYTQMAERLGDAPSIAALPDSEGFQGDDEFLPQESDAIAVNVKGAFGSLAGKELGRAIHAVLEHSVGHVGVDIIALAQRELANEGLAVPGNDSVLYHTLTMAATTPLAYLDGRSLTQIPEGRSVTEMRFMVSLGETTRPEQIRALARAMREFDDSGADGCSIFDAYFATLEVADGFSEGFAVGSLDLVFQRDDGSFVIIDYKTDQMPGEIRPFAPEKIARYMSAHDYALQATLYLVALHRHLVRTMSEYTPESHLGGAAYFLLRSAARPEDPAEDGSFHWRPNPRAIVEASRALGDH
jgi:exodeoxyribonuclease V beta subunit